MSEVQKRTFAIDQIAIDEVTDINQVVPIGRYTAKMTNGSSSISQANNPVATIYLTILEGENEGMDILKRFTMIATERTEANGRKTVFSNAVSEIKAICHAVGDPLPKGYVVNGNPDEVCKLMAQKIGKKKLDVLVFETKYKKNGEEKTYIDSRILGLAGANPGAVTLAAAPSANGSTTQVQAAGAAPGTTNDPLRGLLD